MSVPFTFDPRKDFADNLVALLEHARSVDPEMAGILNNNIKTLGVGVVKEFNASVLAAVETLENDRGSDKND